MSELSRNVSIRSVVGRNDGHTDGNLNFIASRHGWTRTFSLPPSDVAIIDYDMLEATLELNTLKLRSANLRLFVENPPNSGNWSKIRFWKDDGSLQSVLVKEFFKARMDDGIVTSIEVRDGHDREDAVSVRSGIPGSLVPGSLHRPGQTREWLKKNGLTRSLSTRSQAGRSTPHLVEDGTEDGGASVPPKSRMQALKFILGLSKNPPPPPPKTDEELRQEQQNEEEVLRKRGWMPPMLRRITSRKSKAAGGSSNPFFGGGSSRSLVRVRSANIEDEGDGEELNLMDGEGPATKPNPPGAKKANGGWFGFLGNNANGSSSNVNQSQNTAENPFNDPAEANTTATAGSKIPKQRKIKGKKALKQDSKNAEVIGKPSEAFDKGPAVEEIEA